MSITLADLTNDRREMEVEIEGAGTLHLAYRPSAFTAEIEEQVQSQLDKNRTLTAFAGVLETILLEWDLSEKDEVLAIDKPTLKRLPGSFISKVFFAIIEDNRMGGKDTRKNSGGGSRRAAK